VKFCRLQDVIAKDVNLVAETVMKKVAAEAIEENYSDNEMLVAFDGTWQKHRHSSLNGVMTVTIVDTGEVLDVTYMTQYCHVSKGMKNVQHMSVQIQNQEGQLEYFNAQRLPKE